MWMQLDILHPPKQHLMTLMAHPDGSGSPHQDNTPCNTTKTGHEQMEECDKVLSVSA